MRITTRAIIAAVERIGNLYCIRISCFDDTPRSHCRFSSRISRHALYTYACIYIARLLFNRGAIQLRRDWKKLRFHFVDSCFIQQRWDTASRRFLRLRLPFVGILLGSASFLLLLDNAWRCQAPRPHGERTYR